MVTLTTHSFIEKKRASCMYSIKYYHHDQTYLECADLLEVRKKYFEEKFLCLLFQNVDPEKIFDFLRETGVF